MPQDMPETLRSLLERDPTLSQILQSGPVAGAPLQPRVASSPTFADWLGALGEVMGLALPGRGGIGALPFLRFPLRPGQVEVAKTGTANSIQLFQEGGAWVAKYVGPHKKQIVDLFGTDTLPTPFTVGAESGRVLSEIQRLNPKVPVRVAPSVRKELQSLATELPGDIPPVESGRPSSFKALTLTRRTVPDRSKGVPELLETTDPEFASRMLDVLFNPLETSPSLGRRLPF